MSRWTIAATGRQNRREYDWLVLADWRELIEEPDTELLLATEEGEVHGGLLARTEDGKYEIISLFVEEKCRRQGAGSALMEAAEQSAMAGGCDTVEVVYSAGAEEEGQLHHFFLRRGFFFPSSGSSVYSVPTDSLGQSYLAKLPEVSKSAQSHITALDDLSPLIVREFAASFGEKIPTALAPSQAPGDLLQEYSGVYLDKDRVISFVVFSKVGTSLHLHSAYLSEPKHGMALAVLLRRAYDKLAADESQFETFTVTVINEAAQALAEKLLDGAQAIRRTVFRTQKILLRPEPTAPGWGGVLARTNALVSAMAEAGFGTSLCLEPGVLPYLLCSPQKGMEISIFYRAEDDTYAAFSLSAQLLLRIDDQEEAKRVEQAVRDDSGPALLLPSSHTGIYALAAASKEGAESQAERSIEGFLKPFFAQAKRMTDLPGVRVAE